MSFFEKVKMEFASITLSGGLHQLLEVAVAVAIMFVLSMFIDFVPNPFEAPLIFWGFLAVILFFSGMVSRAVQDAFNF